MHGIKISLKLQEKSLQQKRLHYNSHNLKNIFKMLHYLHSFGNLVAFGTNKRELSNLKRNVIF